MITLRHVTKVFATPSGDVRAVDDVNLDVAAGETVCLVGTSGSGKTTTLRMINRLDEATAGSITVGGQAVADTDPISLRRGIGYVIQRGGLFPHMTVRRNIGLLASLEGHPAAEVARRVDRLLGMVGLPPALYADRYPRALSGGQQQRVSVARALVLDPPILLMDEPFGALDPVTRRQLHREFAALKAGLHKTVVLVTHDMAEAFLLGDRIAVMDQGKIVQCGTAAELRQAPATDFVESLLSLHQPPERQPHA